MARRYPRYADLPRGVKNSPMTGGFIAAGGGFDKI
jgi:hypothetical protein